MEPQNQEFEGFGGNQTQPPRQAAVNQQKAKASQAGKEKETGRHLEKQTVSTLKFGVQKESGSGLACKSGKELLETPLKEFVEVRSPGGEKMPETALEKLGVAAIAETETASKSSTNLMQTDPNVDSGLQKGISKANFIQLSQVSAVLTEKKKGNYLTNTQTQPAKVKPNSAVLNPHESVDSGKEEGGRKTLGLATVENFLQDFFIYEKDSKTYSLNKIKLGEFLGLIQEDTTGFKSDPAFSDVGEAKEYLQSDFNLRQLENTFAMGVDEGREYVEELNERGRDLLLKPREQRKQVEYEDILNLVESITRWNEEVRKDIQAYKERRGLLLKKFAEIKKQEKGKIKTKLNQARAQKLQSRNFLVQECLSEDRDRSPLKPEKCAEKEETQPIPLKIKQTKPPAVAGQVHGGTEEEACGGQSAGTASSELLDLTKGSEGGEVERMEGPSFELRKDSGMECSGVSSLLTTSESSLESSGEEEESEEEGAGGKAQRKRQKRKTKKGSKSPEKQVTKEYLKSQYDTDFQSIEEGEAAEKEPILSETSKNRILSRERQISVAWTDCLHTHWDKVTNIILPKDFDRYDTLKLWGYAVAHIALPGSEEHLPSFKKYGRDKLWGILEKSFPLLKSVLSGLKVPQSPEQVAYARTLTLEIIQHLLLGRKPKTSVIILPDWLMETQLIKTFQEIHRVWECSPENQPPLIWAQVDNNAKLVSREALMEWLLTVVADLRQRKKISKQSGFDPLKEKTKGTAAERGGEKMKKWKEATPVEECSRPDRGLGGPSALNPVLGVSATVPPPATGEDHREGKGRMELGREGRNIHGVGDMGNFKQVGTLSDISGSDLDLGATNRVRKKPRPEQTWADRMDSEPVLEAGENGYGFGLGEQGERPGSLAQGRGAGVLSKEDAAGLGFSLSQEKWNNPSLMNEVMATGSRLRQKRFLEDVETTQNGRTFTKPRLDSENNRGAWDKNVSLNPPPDRHTKGREGNLPQGNDTHGEAPQGSSPLPSGSPCGVPADKLQNQRKERMTYANITGQSDSKSGAGPFNSSGLTEEEEEYLDQFFHQASDVRNPRTRFVVRFRYLGSDPEKGSRSYISKSLLKDTLEARREDIVAVIQLPGSKEIDVCLASERVYREFWMNCKRVKRLKPELLEEYEMVPLFRGDTKVLTISFRTTTIPAQDVARWVSRYATILSGPDKKEDEQGYWTGEYRCVVSFKNEDPEYRHGKIPKYFFLGADRGITRYSGQPQACFQCGSYDHQRRLCTTPLCSRCGTRGHMTATCYSSIRCNFCGELGHTYFWCPQAYYNQQDARVFEKAQQVARTGKERAEAREQTRVLRETLRKRGEDIPSMERQGNTGRNKDPEAMIEGQHGVEKETGNAEWNVVRRGKTGGHSREPLGRERPRAQGPGGGNRFQVLAEEEGEGEGERVSVVDETTDAELFGTVEKVGNRPPLQGDKLGGPLVKGQRSQKTRKSRKHGEVESQEVEQEGEKDKEKEAGVEGEAVVPPGKGSEVSPQMTVAEIVIEDELGAASVGLSLVVSEEVEVPTQRSADGLQEPPNMDVGPSFPPPFPPPPYPGPPDALPCPLPPLPPSRGGLPPSPPFAPLPTPQMSTPLPLVLSSLPSTPLISEATLLDFPEEVERKQPEPEGQRAEESGGTMEIELD